MTERDERPVLRGVARAARWGVVILLLGAVLLLWFRGLAWTGSSAIHAIWILPPGARAVVGMLIGLGVFMAYMCWAIDKAIRRIEQQVASIHRRLDALDGRAQR